MSKDKNLLSLAFVDMVAVLTAFANPASVVKDDVVTFEEKYPQQIKTLKIGTRTIHYAWSGNKNKRPLLFVHGSPGSWEAWAHFLVNTKLQENYHIISVDRPGYGGSEDGRVEPSIKTQSELIWASLNENKSGLPAIIVGHSFGGPVIAQLAMSYSEKVAGLLFVATSVSPEFEKIKWYQYPATWWPIRSLIPNKLRVCNEEIFPLKDELLRMLNDWKNIKAKVVIVHGEEDPLVPIGNTDFLVQRLNSKNILKVNRVPKLNHFVPWLRPDLILDGILTLEGGLQ